MRQTERVEVPRPDERIGRRFDIAGRGNRLLDPPAEPLRESDPASRWRDRKHRRDGVVSAQPGHLFDQVERFHQIGPPGRWDDAEPTRIQRCDPAADSGEQTSHLFRRVVDTDDSSRQIRVDLDRRGPWRRPDNRGAGLRRRTTEFHQQVDDTRRRD